MEMSTTTRIQMYKQLAVGVNASTSNMIRTHATHNGKTHYLGIITISRDTGKLIVVTYFSYGSLHLGINTNIFLGLTNLTNEINFYKPLMGFSNDRLQGNN